MTQTQKFQIRTGQRRIFEASNRAITTWYYGGQTESTFYSQRGQRTHRGRKIN